MKILILLILLLPTLCAGRELNESERKLVVSSNNAQKVKAFALEQVDQSLLSVREKIDFWRQVGSCQSLDSYIKFIDLTPGLPDQSLVVRGLVSSCQSSSIDLAVYYIDQN